MNEEVEKGEDDVFDRKVEREDTLVGKLLSRGLVVSDELQLRKIIRLVGYYRLTGYLYPFRQEGGEGYVKGTTLEQIWRLYTFDRRLRGCVMDALSRLADARALAVAIPASICGAAVYDILQNVVAQSHPGGEVCPKPRKGRGKDGDCIGGDCVVCPSGSLTPLRPPRRFCYTTHRAPRWAANHPLSYGNAVRSREQSRL